MATSLPRLFFIIGINVSWSQIETERCHSLGIFLVSLFVLSDKVHRNGSCLFIPEQTFLSETRVVFLSLSRTAVEFKHFRERWADGIMDLHTHCDNKKKIIMVGH